MKPEPVTSPSSHPTQELHALLDAAVDGIALIDHVGRIQAFNRAAERIFGYDAAEIVGSNVSLLMSEADRAIHDAYLARYNATRIPHIIGKGREVTAQRKDRSVFPAFLSVGAVPGAEPPRFVGFIQDLTLRREAEEDSRRLQERLMHVSRLATVGEMASGIAHELNQPLAAIANYAQACDRLLALPDPEIEEIRDALKQVAAQAVRAGEIIRRLRSLARGHDTTRVPTEVNTLIEELTDLVQADAKAHDVQYRLELAAGLPKIDADGTQVQQVVLNLVRNALEALSETSGGGRDVTVSTALTQNGDVEICVCDTGPGVPPSVAHHLFHPFCTSKPTGTGLGLAISRTIVSAHHGTLEHRANTPSGACFTARIPAMRTDDP